MEIDFASLSLSCQILAGCDYLDSIPGIGIKTAHKLLRKHKSVEKVRALAS
jgi:5'-3' exonuclease